MGLDKLIFSTLYNLELQKKEASDSFIENLIKSEELGPRSESTDSLMNRTEDKYLIKREHLSFLTTALADKLKEGDIDTEVRYNTNQSIYLDNKDLDAFKEALEEIKPRLKVRVRRYAPNETDWEKIAYLELKIKTANGDTKKTRIRIPEEIIADIISGKNIIVTEDLININKDITKEILEKRAVVINSIINKYGLKKQVTITYKRRAYSNKKIRVTIDDNIKYSEMQSILIPIEDSIKESDNWKEWNKKYTKGREKDYIITEVKHEGELPDWIKDLLDKVDAKQVSFSKYCAAIMSYINSHNPSGIITRNMKIDVNRVINQIYPNISTYLIPQIYELGKSEVESLLKPWSSQAQAAWGHSPEGKKALGGEAAIKEWDRATKGKHLPKHVKKTEQLKKAPFVNEDYGMVNLPYHPSKEGKYHSTTAHKPSGIRVHKYVIPENQGTIYAITENGHHTGKVASQIHVHNNDPESGEEVPHVAYALTEKGHEGKGLSSLLHQTALRDYGTLSSDTRLSPKSNHIWEKLGNNPKNKVSMAPTKGAASADSRHVATYTPEKLAASEELEKGALKNMLVGGMMAGALASNSAIPKEHNVNPYSSQRMLDAISQVESSGGKNMNHKPTSQGTAYGRWALMPSVIHDTIRLNPQLRQEHGKALRLQGQYLTNYMHDNPGLDQKIANSHLQRLEHHFGQNPVDLSYAWNQGVTGTNRALKEKKDISQHPYVQKFTQAYSKEGE